MDEIMSKKQVVSVMVVLVVAMVLFTPNSVQEMTLSFMKFMQSRVDLFFKTKMYNYFPIIVSFNMIY